MNVFRNELQFGQLDSSYASKISLNLVRTLSFGAGQLSYSKWKTGCYTLPWYTTGASVHAHIVLSSHAQLNRGGGLLIAPPIKLHFKRVRALCVLQYTSIEDRRWGSVRTFFSPQWMQLSRIQL